MFITDNCCNSTKRLLLQGKVKRLLLQGKNLTHQHITPTSYPTSKRLYYPTSKRLYHQIPTYINIYKHLLLQGKFITSGLLSDWNRVE